MHTCLSGRWTTPDIWSMLYMQNEFHKWHPYLSVSYACAQHIVTMWHYGFNDVSSYLYVISSTAECLLMAHINI